MDCPLAVIDTVPLALSPLSVAVMVYVPASVTVNTAVPVLVLVCVVVPLFSQVTVEPLVTVTVMVDAKNVSVTS